MMNEKGEVGEEKRRGSEVGNTAMDMNCGGAWRR
jgi:hypothetical protein